MKDKINLIFLPYVLVFVSLMVGYTAINWLLFIKLELFSTKEGASNLLIPMVITALATFFVIMPRVRILKLESSRGKKIDLYGIVAWIALLVPLVITQDYLTIASGELTRLETINEIVEFPPSKYYIIKQKYVERIRVGLHTESGSNGKYNQNFTMSMYVALPLFENESDILKNEPVAWLGTKYSKTVSNSLEGWEKDTIYREFTKSTLEDITDFNDSIFRYFKRIGNSNNRDGYLKAVESNKYYKPNDTILVGVTEPYEARFGDKLLWILGSTFLGSILWLIMILIPKTHKRLLKRAKEGYIENTGTKALYSIREFFEILSPREGYFITPIIILINIGVFLLLASLGLGFMNVSAQDLLNCGGNYRPCTINGQWWRLLTSNFLHGGIGHLILNMVSLLLVGIFLEPVLGRIKFLILYLLTGIMASVASIWWYEATVSVGASGAVFGLYGAGAAFALLKVYEADFSKVFGLGIVIFVLYNLFLGISGGVDNAAHIGGLVSGFVLGVILQLTFNLRDDTISR